jgi:hypothetical protein
MTGTHTISTSLFVKMGSLWLASNRDPPHLHLLNSQDYIHESPCPVLYSFSKKGFCFVLFVVFWKSFFRKYNLWLGILHLRASYLIAKSIYFLNFLQERHMGVG